MALVNAERAVAAAPASDIASALAIMGALDGALSEGDGVVWFNRLYWRVSQRVALELRKKTFERPAFIDRLDVVFANYWF